jgi:hypothetical protein
MPKRLRAALAGAFQPLVDGRFADPHCLGELALGPAFVLELPGLQATNFFPIRL